MKNLHKTASAKNFAGFIWQNKVASSHSIEESQEQKELSPEELNVEIFKEIEKKIIKTIVNLPSRGKPFAAINNEIGYGDNNNLISGDRHEDYLKFKLDKDGDKENDINVYVGAITPGGRFKY